MKIGPRRQNARDAGAVNASRRTVETVETDKKIAMCMNRSANCTPANASQTHIATLISEKRHVTAYESGKAILKSLIISKTPKKVGCEGGQGQVKCSIWHW